MDNRLVVRGIPPFIQSLATLEQRAARMNAALGVVGADLAVAIVHAGDRIASGGFTDQFLGGR